jgi:hypothetical protein
VPDASERKGIVKQSREMREIRIRSRWGPSTVAGEEIADGGKLE